MKIINCFDWDDNILFMPTNIVLFNDKNEEVIMTTEDFAIHRNYIGSDFKFSIKDKKFNPNGMSHNLKDFHIKGDNEKNSSFREFRDCDNKYFLSHLKEAINNKSFAPEWENFINSLEEKKTAKNTYIITARGHSPQTIYNGIKYLHRLGIIKNLVPRKNIFPVSHEKFRGCSKNPQKVKLRIFKDILNKAHLMDYNKVLFSDDDLSTISFIKKKIKEFRNENLWENLEIVLKYTGEDFFEKNI